MTLVGTVIVVTGAASGIGRAVALALAREGASLGLLDRDPGLLDRTAMDASAIGLSADRILTGAADVRNEGEVEAVVHNVLERFGRLDALVHCAGILRSGGGMPRPLADTSVAEWDEVLDVNLKGTFLCNRAVLPAMIRQREGQIINLSSTSGRRGRALDGPYCASKFGVIGLTESLAEEVSGFGIKVLAILPDAVKTPLWRQNGPVPVPDDALEPDRVADLIVYVLKLPRDTILGHVTIAAVRARRRKARPAPEAAVNTVDEGAKEKGRD